jgi:hypothetical protein
MSKVQALFLGVFGWFMIFMALVHDKPIWFGSATIIFFIALVGRAKTEAREKSDKANGRNAS